MTVTEWHAVQSAHEHEAADEVWDERPDDQEDDQVSAVFQKLPRFSFQRRPVNPQLEIVLHSKHISAKKKCRFHCDYTFG